jgi:Cytosolic domain of 10TM putative phosphate transporter/Calcium-dependent channel, 7TM region, putative phosphate
MVDAEDYYKEKIIKKSKRIREAKEERLKSNCGYGFVSFASNL